jgi:hypothetical protein
MESGLEPASLSVSGAFNDVASKRGLISMFLFGLASRGRPVS